MNAYNPALLILIMFAVALLPVLMGLATAYLKVSIVLGLFKNALGAQQVPGALIIMAISLAITMLIMQPVLNESLTRLEKIKLADLEKQKLSDIIGQFGPVILPFKNFIQKNAGESELKSIRQLKTNADPLAAYSYSELMSAFMLTELKEAFLAGFAIMFPFLLIDLVVANLLAGLSLQMVSPVMVSLPLKILLIVVLDVWLMIFKGLFFAYA